MVSSEPLPGSDPGPSSAELTRPEEVPEAAASLAEPPAESPSGSPSSEVSEADPDAPQHGRLKRAHIHLHRHPVTSVATKIVLTVVGFAVILVGVVLSGPGVPGPGFVVILLGLAILAAEWDWADRLLQWGRRKVEAAADHARGLDPAVRRRRLLLTGLAVLVVVGLSWWYVAAQGWPGWAVSGWDRMQGLAGFLPDLPGM